MLEDKCKNCDYVSINKGKVVCGYSNNLTRLEDSCKNFTNLEDEYGNGQDISEE